MATEVLLMAVVDGLGKEGDVVSVADGYARNYLLPRDLAAPVTEATRRRLAKLQVEREKELAETLSDAKALAKKVSAASCTIAVKVGEGEQLYGSVSESDIVDSLKSQDIEIDRHQVVLSDPIKQLGAFDVAVNLHPQLETTLKVWVVEE
ncbi:MAG: 50S ribosomal protein L9 [Kiritimatiellia bacterium]|jgi:large subunit ribosomal protein L9|nr:50S ribosomal protein L9 [Kiritimatiellia bacterium]MDP6629717.1 50S ribosomal protein L9 [Kiritimatiellia bacterium]MDP6810956.1 50S ribosomal protein L9 [Kiritimatiellia bacterium]MDP7023261.1 50S ribosomal protein L9 [Kiritimatiellia bacterium]